MADTAPVTPLPRGRHKLSREEVRASQRARLLQSMETLVNEQGYAATSVPAVVKHARVTGRTFYELFDDKADCFIALCEQHGDGLRDLLDAYVAVIESADDPLAAFDAGLAFYLQWWMERPGGSRAFFVELPAVGERAYASRDGRAALFATALGRIGAALRERAGLPPGPQPGDATAAAAVAMELVARDIRAGRLSELPALHPQLRRVLLLLLVGELPAAFAEPDQGQPTG